MRKLVYYIAASIDGFIADAAGDVSCFPLVPETLEHLFDRYPETCPAHLREAFGVTAGPKRFDTVLLGRRTQEPALQAGLVAGAYPHLRQIVATHRGLPESAGIELIEGDLAPQITALKRQSGGDIWLCGGGDIAGQLIDLIDEVQLKVNPVLLGDGIGLFGRVARCREFLPVGMESLPGGVTLATYRAAAPAPAA
ncbi:dihydrofolate reductase family protein [Agrococcus sp. ProA11]|uniref:dihydrofolate reductase family protein n=1 Tax=Agrococcus chionoecetis TaxID=3153752 RepID=UPI00326049CB